MQGTDFRAWRNDLKLTQETAGARYGVSHLTVQKWESGEIEIPSHVDQLSTLITCEIKKRQDDFPVVLTYFTEEQWVKPGRPLALIVLKEFPNNTAMLRDVHQLIQSGNPLHDATVIEKGKLEISIWSREELLKEIEQLASLPKPF